MILLNEDTKCLVQGITGKQGSFHTEQMLKYNTNIVAGLTPGKGGQDFMGVPIFNSMEEAVEEVDVNASIIFVPARFAKDAAFEAIRHLDLVVIISEHIPVHDSMKIMDWIAENTSSDCRLVSIMSQYTPFNFIPDAFPELKRRITKMEYNSVVRHAESLGINGFTQDISSAREEYLPIFNLEGIISQEESL